MPRLTLRRQLLARREAFASSPDAAAADAALANKLATVLRELEPDVLGLYWALGSEFNAARSLAPELDAMKWPLALPFTRRSPREMHYRAWDGQSPTLLDECGIGSCAGAVVVPDVLLVPCVGFTADGFRLGYGGGYFDRWLALHPGVTTIGVAWSCAQLDPDAFEPQPHDQALTVIVTECGVVAA